MHQNSVLSVVNVNIEFQYFLQILFDYILFKLLVELSIERSFKHSQIFWRLQAHAIIDVANILLGDFNETLRLFKYELWIGFLRAAMSYTLYATQSTRRRRAVNKQFQHNLQWQRNGKTLKKDQVII